MTWEAIIPLIANYGLPFAESVYQKWGKGGEVTQEDIDALKVLAANNARTQLLSAAARHGMTPDDPFVRELLGMTPEPPPTNPS